MAAVQSGDYNADGSLDAADYVVWRKNVGAPDGTLPNDIDGGTIGPAQYNTWRSYFGDPVNVGTGSGGFSSEATVPEPSTLVMLILAAAGWYLRRSRVA